jgi:Protein of unknown function (DUF3082)
MTDINPTPPPSPPNSTSGSTASGSTSGNVPPTPGRCFRGGLISGGLAFAMYSLTQSIIQVLANTPLPNKSTVAANIAVAVRTLIVGVCTLGTTIFAIATLGLFALGVQLLIQQGKPNR